MDKGFLRVVLPVLYVIGSWFKPNECPSCEIRLVEPLKTPRETEQDLMISVLQSQQTVICPGYTAMNISSRYECPVCGCSRL